MTDVDHSGSETVSVPAAGGATLGVEYHRVRVLAAGWAATTTAVMAIVWRYPPAWLVVALAVGAVAHGLVHLRRSISRYASTILFDIVVVSLAIGILRAPPTVVIPVFGYLLAAPILLASGRRAITMVVLALVSVTMAIFAREVWPPEVEWTLVLTLVVTVGILGAFGPLVAWLISTTSRQIGERDRYRLRLERSERRLADIIRGAPIGMEITRPGSLEITAANPAFCEFLGYSVDELVGMTIPEIVHPDDFEATRPLTRALEAGERGPVREDIRYIRSDGEVVWGSLSLAMLTGPDGTPDALVGQVQDVTEAKMVQRQRDLLLRLTTRIISSDSADQAMEAVLEGLGREGRWTLGEIWVPNADDTLTRTHAWFDDPALEELVAESPRHRPRDWGLVSEAIRSRRSITVSDFGGDERVADRHVSAEYGLETALAVPVLHDDQILAVLVLIGPDRPDRAGDEAVESVASQLSHVVASLLVTDERDRLAAILENTSDLVGIADPDGVVQWLNPAGRRMLGIPPEVPVSGQPIARMRSDENAEIVAGTLRIAAERGMWRGETTIPTGDGREIPVSQVVLAHRDRGGALSFFSTVARDISAQKAVEAHQEGLIHAKDRFIASVSHELRTPLTGILGFTELLLDPPDDLTAAEREDMLRTIAHEAADVGTLVEDLLVAARADIDQLVVRPEDVRVDDAIRSVEELIRWRDQQVEFAGPDTTAFADPQRLRQILRNLLLNAARYGGRNVRIETVEEPRRVRIRVCDDGPGIDRDQAETIFEPYTRGDHGLGRTESVGLGLSVSRQLARLMDGDVSYGTEAGWSVFEVELPRSPDGEAAAGRLSASRRGVW